MGTGEYQQIMPVGDHNLPMDQQPAQWRDQQSGYDAHHQASQAYPNHGYPAGEAYDTQAYAFDAAQAYHANQAYYNTPEPAPQPANEAYETFPASEAYQSQAYPAYPADQVYQTVQYDNSHVQPYQHIQYQQQQQPQQQQQQHPEQGFEQTFQDQYRQQGHYVQPNVAHPKTQPPQLSDLQQDTGHRAFATAASSKGARTRSSSVWTKSIRSAGTRIKWSHWALFTVCLQATIGVALDAYTLAKWNGNIIPDAPRIINDPLVRSEVHMLPTILSLLLWFLLYQVLLIIDALRFKNTIQIMGIVALNVIVIVYMTVLVQTIDQVLNGIEDVFKQPGNKDTHTTRDFGIGFICMLIAFTGAIGFLAWKLYQEFAWDWLKTIGADHRIRRMYFHFQIYVTLLKFDLFFLLGWAVQVLVVVGIGNDNLTGLTIAFLPLTPITIIAAYIFTRKEWKYPAVLTIFLYVLGLAYFIFMTARMYDPAYSANYMASRTNLTIWAVFCMVSLAVTVVYAVVCIRNFGGGLRENLEKPRVKIDGEQSSHALSDRTQPGAQNFTIE